MFELLIYAFAFVLAAIVSGNNLAACSGSVIYSGIVNKKTGITLAVVGYLLGFLVEGGLLKAGLLTLMPVNSEILVILALGIALAVFTVAHTLKVPESLSITFTMAIIGIGYGYGSHANTNFISTVIGFWILSGLSAAILTIITMNVVRKFTDKLKVWNAIKVIKVLLILVCFFTAFVLGANTIGFLYAAVYRFTDPIISEILIIIGIVVGSVLLSAGELNRMGTQILPLRYINALVSQGVSMILVELGTIYSIPTSSTETFTASLYGAGLSYGVRLIPKRPMLTILFAWILTALISFTLGYGLTYAIYHL